MRDTSVIIVGGGVMGSGIALRLRQAGARVMAEGLRGILSLAMELCPALGSAPVQETWAGLRPYTEDHLPLLGAGRFVSIASPAAEPPGRHSTPPTTRPSSQESRKTSSGWPSAARSS